MQIDRSWFFFSFLPRENNYHVQTRCTRFISSHKGGCNFSYMDVLLDLCSHCALHLAVQGRADIFPSYVSHGKSDWGCIMVWILLDGTNEEERNKDRGSRRKTLSIFCASSVLIIRAQLKVQFSCKRPICIHQKQDVCRTAMHNKNTNCNFMYRSAIMFKVRLLDKDVISAPLTFAQCLYLTLHLHHLHQKPSMGVAVQSWLQERTFSPDVSTHICHCGVWCRDRRWAQSKQESSCSSMRVIMWGLIEALWF